MAIEFRRNAFWTRERVIQGLKNFYADFGFCPTDDGQFNDHRSFTGRAPDGRVSLAAWHQRYPSTYGINKFFKSMREAWEAAGFDMNRAFMEWSTTEDWFVLESVGILPREEVSKLLKRSVPAIKRRLYDLGDIRSYNRWGVTLTCAEKMLGLGISVIRKYLDLGIIPYFKGHKLYYLNPADLLKVQEVDWTKPVAPELDKLIRNAIAQRISKMAAHGADWRKYELYQFHKTKERYTGRIRNPRQSAFSKLYPPAPNGIAAGDWVQITRKMAHFASDVSANRKGIVKALLYSPQQVKRLDGVKRACWIARVEFPKMRKIRGEASRRVKYSIPLDCLVKVDPPEIPPPAVKQTPEAVRARKRFAAYTARGRERFQEIRRELS